MELIIAEKNNAAERIADILSDGRYSSESKRGVNVYRWGDNACIGLAGHVVEVDFTDEYNDWGEVKPSELIEAEITKNPKQKNIINTVRDLASKADRVVIATDYDSEGELIGLEAVEVIEDEISNVPVDRVRFSSLTPGEVRNAFENRDDIDMDLAHAGETRQVIDLIWGAALTRYLSLTSRRLGDSFLSVGRVQSPTLKILVDREREIEEFEPEPYWEIYADLRDGEEFEAQYFYRDDGKEQERIWDEDTAYSVFEAVDRAQNASVESVDTRTRRDYPPPPFDTTQFIRAAGAIGFSAQRAMNTAENLYTQGYISYPRTDNTVYPDDIDTKGVLEMFTSHPEFSEHASELLEGKLSPTKGDKETTDHPPIYPTALVDEAELNDYEWRIYELVVRRFFATFAEPAQWEHIKAVMDVNGESFKANGKRLIDPGYHRYYPYFNTSENIIPELEENEELSVSDSRIEDKETQPPNRIGQSKLIETMESEGVGTKSTRHNTIQKLYDRGYIEENPPRPTGLARAVIGAMEEYADLVTNPEMTRQLEEDMKKIAEGDAEPEEVREESREMLDRIFEILEDQEDEIGEALREGLRADRTLGPCPECGESLMIRRSRYGNPFVGCDGYPDCENTYPLPDKGKLLLTDDVCEEHELQHVKVLAGRNTYVHGCPICKAEEAEEDEGEVIGDCPQCEDGELAIKKTRRGGRLVGCTRYPDCDYSLPLPRRGDLVVTDEICEEHGLPEVEVHKGNSEPWELGCPICNYENYQRERNKNRELEDIKGIGEATAEKLRNMDIDSIEELKEADPDEVAENIKRTSADKVREWQSAA